MVGTNEVRSVSIINYDPDNDYYISRAYENHSFDRDYITRVDGDVWTFTGHTERARIEFTDGGDSQKIFWEWRKPDEPWLPLCDRVAKLYGKLRTQEQRS